MPSGKGSAGDESRPSKGVRGGTTKGSSAAVKRLLNEINVLPSADKKELSGSLMGLALIEDEKHEKERRDTIECEQLLAAAEKKDGNEKKRTYRGLGAKGSYLPL